MQISDGSLRSRLRRRLINCMVIYTYVKNQLATFIEGEERRADLCNIFAHPTRSIILVIKFGVDIWATFQKHESEA